MKRFAAEIGKEIGFWIFVMLFLFLINGCQSESDEKNTLSVNVTERGSEIIDTEFI